MEVLKCKMCGGELELTENASICKCKYCGSMQTLPRERSDIRVNAYNRAGRLFMNGDFDKALALYEKILLEDPEDANAYWSCILCKYGVNYVEDATTHERKITVNRTQNTAVVADDTYKQAIKYATAEQREIFEKDAAEIDEIQKGIIAISQNEKPFDVFISYKETDQRGERTVDSVLATDLYYGLTEAGYKVFLSRITLEDKLGREYEPYIYAALNSAKVMIVLGTKAEYFNAPWVKNEWSRYLQIIKGDRHKMLIPAYRDMDAYDLPEEFALLQAQDMSKIGFLQDIIRGVKKVIGANAPVKAVEKVVEKTVVKESNDKPNGNIDNLKKRLLIFIDNKQWDKADEYVDRALDVAPTDAELYYYQVLIHYKKDDIEAITDENVLKNYAFINCKKFATGDLSTKISAYEEKLRDKLKMMKKKSEIIILKTHQRELLEKENARLFAKNDEIEQNMKANLNLNKTVLVEEDKKKMIRNVAITTSIAVIGLIIIIAAACADRNVWGILLGLPLVMIPPSFGTTAYVYRSRLIKVYKNKSLVYKELQKRQYITFAEMMLSVFTLGLSNIFFIMREINAIDDDISAAKRLKYIDAKLEKCQYMQLKEDDIKNNKVLYEYYQNCKAIAKNKVAIIGIDKEINSL